MTELTFPLDDRLAGPYTAGAGQTIFTYDFPVKNDGELAVWFEDAGAGTVTRLALTADYTVQNAGAQGGGTITLVMPAVAGDKYAIFGALDVERITDFAVKGLFKASNVNAELDSVAVMIQELRRDADRSLQKSKTGGEADPFDAGGKRITGVGVATADGDVMPKSQIDALVPGAAAHAAADAAAASAAAAALSETDAETAQAAAEAAQAAAEAARDEATAGMDVKNSLEINANEAQLVGDQAAPGENKHYGTNAAGVKGWQDTGELLSDIETNLTYFALVNARQSAAPVNIIQGTADAFASEAAVDNASSVNENYDAAGDFYEPALAWETIWSLALDTDQDAWNNFSSRQVIEAAGVSAVSGQQRKTRVTFEAAVAEAGTITSAYIGHKAGGGDAYDFAAAPVPLTFDTGSASKAMAAGATGLSDPVDFGWDETSGIVISFFANGGTSNDAFRVRNAVANAENYAKSGDDAATVNATGYNAAGAYDVAAINKIEGAHFAALDLRSTAFPASGVPASGRLMIEVDELDSATVNTDFKGYLSRDGGATWAEAALALKFTTADGRRIYEAADIDLSGQPSGSDVRARFTTHNAKHVRLHGWARAVS